MTPELQSQIQSLAKSGNAFPVDFDLAWQWIGYARKDVAKDALVRQFAVSVDFMSFPVESGKLGGRPVECIMLTVDCFKAFCMMAGTEMGRQVRAYFIECERALKSGGVSSRIGVKQLLRNAIDEIDRLEAMNAENLPKVQTYQTLMDSSGGQPIGAVAKTLGYGQNKFFAMLRADGILRQDNLPLAEYEHLFAVRIVARNGYNYHVSLVNPEGMEYLARKYGRAEVAVNG